MECIKIQGERKKMKNLISFMLLFLILPVLVLPTLCQAEIESLGIFKLNNCIELLQSCSNCTYVNVSSVLYPNSSQALGQVQLTKIGTKYNYTSCAISSDLGTYIVNGFGDVDGVTTVFAYDYEVTYLGKQLDSGKSILYIGFLSLLVLIFFLNFYGMGYLPSRNQKDEQGRIMSINYLKYFRNVLWMTGYFLFIGIIYISSNLAFAFLGEELLAKTLFIIYRVSFGLAPVVVIVWMIFIFASIFHDKEFQRMLNRGMLPGGNW